MVGFQPACHNVLIHFIFDMLLSGFFYTVKRPRGRDKLNVVKYDPRGACVRAWMTS